MAFSNRTQGTRIRLPAVAGLFYPVHPDELAETVDKLIEQARSSADSKAEGATRSTPESTPETIAHRIKALIVPHAGYIYSGATAAEAFKLLQGQAGEIQRIVLLGPSHRVGFQGMALSTANQFRTPLGDIPLDVDLAKSLEQLPDVQFLDAAHDQEHSLEVQLPFLQRLLNNFLLLPVVVGEAEQDSISQLLEHIWQLPNTLIIISSDLSHFLTYNDANMLDRQTCVAITKLAPADISYEQACGRNPVKGLLVSAKKHGLVPLTLALCNSGDTAGDKQRVVGYGAWAFIENNRSTA